MFMVSWCSHTFEPPPPPKLWALSTIWANPHHHQQQQQVTKVTKQVTKDSLYDSNISYKIKLLFSFICFFYMVSRFFRERNEVPPLNWFCLSPPYD